jgi:hypothetical protein
VFEAVKENASVRMSSIKSEDMQRF